MHNPHTIRALLGAAVHGLESAEEVLLTLQPPHATSAAVASDGCPSSSAFFRNVSSSTQVAVGVSRGAPPTERVLIDRRDLLFPGTAR
jgi:hypothetical protein